MGRGAPPSYLNLLATPMPKSLRHPFARALVIAYAVYSFGLANPDAVWRDHFDHVDGPFALKLVMELLGGFAFVVGGLAARAILRRGDGATDEGGALKTRPDKPALLFAAFMVTGSVLMVVSGLLTLAGIPTWVVMTGLAVIVLGLSLMESSTTGMLLSLGRVVSSTTRLTAEQKAQAKLATGQSKAGFYAIGAISSAALFGAGGWSLTTVVAVLASIATLVAVLGISRMTTGRGGSFAPDRPGREVGPDGRRAIENGLAQNPDFRASIANQEWITDAPGASGVPVVLVDRMPAGFSDVVAYTWFHQPSAPPVIVMTRDTYTALVRTRLLADVLGYEYHFRVRSGFGWRRLAAAERLAGKVAAAADVTLAAPNAVPGGGLSRRALRRVLKNDPRASSEIDTVDDLRRRLAEHQRVLADLRGDALTRHQQDELDVQLMRAFAILAEAERSTGAARRLLVARYSTRDRGTGRSLDDELVRLERLATAGPLARLGVRLRGALRVVSTIAGLGASVTFWFKGWVFAHGAAVLGALASPAALPLGDLVVPGVTVVLYTVAAVGFVVREIWLARHESAQVPSALNPPTRSVPALARSGAARQSAVAPPRPPTHPAAGRAHRPRGRRQSAEPTGGAR
ncbi:hypothetical protein BJF90_09180 [Pseudonocardia sp. CNS-004]|nr:hypothetical protein BJF90_09180 [Pseudonocardia sp. CNS-004]